MNPPFPPDRHGAVMVFAVLLMSAGVFVLAAVLQLSATQGLSGDTEWAALRTRVTLLNSRSLARQHLLTRLFRVPQDTNAWPVTFSNALGSFSVNPADPMPSDNYWTELSTTNTNVVININPFNLMERGGFYREIFVADLADGNTNTGDGVTKWAFALRMRSPVSAGYTFSQHRPANNNVALLAVPPYIDMSATGEKFTGFYGLPRMPVSSVTNVNTRATGDANGYQGYLDVPAGASTYGYFTNFVHELRGNTNTNEAQVVLDLTAADPNIATAVLRYDHGLDSVNVTNGATVYSNLPVTAMVLLGSTIAGQKPVQVVVPPFITNPATGLILPITNLALLVLSNDNDRLVYFNRTKQPDDGRILSVSAQGASRWRIGLTMTQCRLRFGLSGVIVTGGLRSDSSVTYPSGTVEIRPEYNPAGLDFIADRVMWLEDYRAATW